MPVNGAAASETTFSPPESVTIPGEIALEALALLDAYAEAAAEFRLDGEPEPFFVIEETVFNSLTDALGRKRGDDLAGPLWDAMKERSSVLEDQIRSNFDGPALGAIAATKMAHDIVEVKTRLEYVGSSRVRMAS